MHNDATDERSEHHMHKHIQRGILEKHRMYRSLYLCGCRRMSAAVVSTRHERRVAAETTELSEVSEWSVTEGLM